MSPRAIVIGSGPGGLAAAAHLARSGFRVLTLEQAPQLGGLINPFTRRRYEFDPGCHYVGECAPGGATHAFFEDLGIDAESVFCELDPDGFDRYVFPGFELSACRGAERYRDRLVEHFPKQVRGIDRFFGLLRAFKSVADVLTRSLPRRALRLSDAGAFLRATPVLPFVRSTLGAVLHRCISDPELRALLGANCGTYGLPPGRVSAFYAMSILTHFLDGAFYPRGGARALRDCLVDYARQRGGDFSRRSAVEAIEVRDGRAVAVRTADGTSHRADVVISAIDPTVTFSRLIGEQHLPRRLRATVARSQPSLATLCLFVGMRRDLRKHGFASQNVWHYPDSDIDRLYAPLFAGKSWERPALFLAPNSLKDDTGSLAPEGCSTLEIMTFAPYDDFAPWGEGKSLKRPAEYADVKQRYIDRTLTEVERGFPGLIGDVEVLECGTPATTQYYTRPVRGGVYGPAATPEQSVAFRYRPTTPLPNVFLAGGGVFYGSGVAPALYSGQLAARLATETIPTLAKRP